MITVCTLGQYANRQPFAYPQIRAQCRSRFQVIDRMDGADIVILSHPKDLDNLAGQLRRRLSAAQRVVLLSEEPFWDTIWGRTPLVRNQFWPTPMEDLPVTVLNHHTSAIYDFDTIPYFLLTEYHFMTRYRRWFARNAARRPSDWQVHFRAAPYQAGFLMARRQSPRYDVAFPEAEVFSLCNQRTAMAEACQGPGFWHRGQGWHPDTPRRQALPDWHLNKFLSLDRQLRFLCAVENTHQHNYVTEKIFDAYAIGAIPLYAAGPRHRVHEIAKAGTFLNLIDTPPSDLPDRLAQFDMDAAFCDSYAHQQRGLATLFADQTHLIRELDRLSQALEHECIQVLASR